jgi:indole-3-glycerol phosphate synthase
MSDFLKQMALSSQQRLNAARQRCPEPKLLQQALACAAAPPLQRNLAGFDLIAEVKLRSPAAGALAQTNTDVASRVQAYVRGGAAAVSVLTEPTRFDGALSHLEAAVDALQLSRVPVMRKDFLIDPYQLIEARLHGAGGVLVIVRMLSHSQIDAMLDCARTLGLFVLLEAFDEQDLELMHAVIGPRHAAATSHAVAGGHAAAGDRGQAGTMTDPAAAPLLVGVNCRDLSSLQIVPQRLLQLVGSLPSGLPRVAESGVICAADAARVAASGYQYALVGSALMQGGQPEALTAAMLAAGRQAVRARAEAGGAL